VIILCVFYVIVFLILTLGVKTYALKNRKHKNFFSVIVPFRNEKKHLPSFLQAMKNQSWPHFEMIFVNDHSADQGEELFSREEVTVLHLIDEYGKLAALGKGSTMANGDYLTFTDADCVPPPKWLESLNRSIHEEAVLYAGFVEIRGSSFFTLDMYMLIGIAAGLDFYRIPSSCAGGNLTVRRDIYELFLMENTDSESLTEDALLLHTVAKHRWGDSFFLFDPNTVVKTEKYASVKEFVQQRLRWLKGGYRLDLRLFLFLAFIFVCHVLFVLSPLYLIPAALAQFVFLRTLLKRFDRVKLLYLFPFYFVFHVIYTILSGLLFLFLSGEVEWKGRKY